MKKLVAEALAGLTMMVSNAAFGQDIFTDVFREAVDEVRLRQDYRALQRDLAYGNTAGAQYDLMRIQQDSSNLARDQMQLNFDLNRGAGLMPYQNYGGYYPSAGYPAGSAQMYYTPAQLGPQQFAPPQIAPQQIVPQQLAQPQIVSQQFGPPLNPVPTGVPFVPANPVAGIPQVVRISNPLTTGVTLSFLFGGKTYSVDAGRTEEFSVTSPTIISFSRGGQAGVARYTLAGGNTFEFKYDNSGWYLVQKRPDQLNQPTDVVPPNPVGPGPALSNQLPPSPVGGPSTSPGPGAVAP